MGRAATAAARTAPARTAPGPRPPRRPAPPRRASGARKVATVARPHGARVLDALLTGRSWIALVGVLLTGIVFLNVDLLQLNREITQMADRAARLKRENARIRLDVARLASSERIQETAGGLGLVLPAPSDVRYLDSRPAVDARRASKRMSAPEITYVAPAAVAPEPLAPDPAAPVADPAATPLPGAG